MDPVGVLIAEDNPRVRNALASIVDSDPSFEVVGLAGTPDEAVNLARLHQPRVALVDARMPGDGGAGATTRMLQLRPAPRVIAISATDEGEMVIEMLRAGAVGYLVKGGPVDELLSAIRRADRGQMALQPPSSEETRGPDTEPHPPEREGNERLERMISGEDLWVAFQPICELAERRPVGYEALARFPGPDGRTPSDWFSEARRAGLESELELAAIKRAIESAQTIWRAGGSDGEFISMNASPETICSPQFADVVEGAAQDRLVLEVTEHAAVRDYGRFKQGLEPLRAKGVRLAVDDLGAGYASLRHVLQLEPEVIKLDLSLTKGIDDDRHRRSMAAALISFVREADAMVVAEGIETRAELETLRELGATWGQGYYLGRPVVSAGGPLWAAEVSA